jgi:hypothetical protein
VVVPFAIDLLLFLLFVLFFGRCRRARPAQSRSSRGTSAARHPPRGGASHMIVSGRASTYRERIARGIGIECAQAIPRLLELGGLDDIARLVAPRPLLLCSADQDKYSWDAPRIAEAAAYACRSMGAPEALPRAGRARPYSAAFPPHCRLGDCPTE